MKDNMNRLFKDQRSVHVLYSYNEIEKYIEQAVNYIEDGVMAGDYIIFIENEPLFRLINKELRTRLTEDQMKFVHSVNNYDFYYSSGSYHPPAILDYFNKMVEPYIENDLSFRSWAHVEWATMKDPLHIIEDFERIVDEAVSSSSFPLICAYEGEKMPDHLIKILMETHPYVLKDDNFTISNEYQLASGRK
ncbi:MEDS domain-containing protein [Bacillus sp. ISL-55]|uniref:MEDS domain-containing protein n=1 Tax=Bacillus sp. ISL-55 TaxID=2819134 RepID=UPI001BEB36F9|nr:MEDS domain-containing protein [Bacillus sp. ISL-55]MBT2694309.1 MEDS domain-containing protein [Bacillus sp. ISL-55]